LTLIGAATRYNPDALYRAATSAEIWRDVQTIGSPSPAARESVDTLPARHFDAAVAGHSATSPAQTPAQIVNSQR
jgi:hypothetical protein